MKIIAGLGNPGPQYKNTRHNLGFEVLDLFAEQLGVRLDREKHRGLFTQVRVGGESVLLVKPLTYMNRCGDCLAPMARNKVEDPADILVVVDDVNLPLGRVRIRAGGSAGGHNGLKSLIERLGTRDFPRLRLGVGEETRGPDLADYVLAKFRPEERETVSQAMETACEAIRCWVERGTSAAMNAYNG
ncbi:MAG: aminoacyl-tRNA hydrolase [Candidatus Hydrogenedentota bacterium]